MPVGWIQCSRLSLAKKRMDLPSGKRTWQYKWTFLKMYFSFWNMVDFHCYGSLPEGISKLSYFFVAIVFFGGIVHVLFSHFLKAVVWGFCSIFWGGSSLCRTVGCTFHFFLMLKNICMSYCQTENGQHDAKRKLPKVPSSTVTSSKRYLRYGNKENNQVLTGKPLQTTDHRHCQIHDKI